MGGGAWGATVHGVTKSWTRLSDFTFTFHFPTLEKEMASVNIDILGISELKWIEMGELNSDDHYIYYCGQESLRRNGVAITVNKGV